MYFQSFRVRNYKSIRDSGTLPLRRLNILAGRNNSGKTASLEALFKLNSTNVEGWYHSDPTYHDVDIEVHFSDEEMQGLKQFSNNDIQTNVLLFTFSCSGSQTFFKGFMAPSPQSNYVFHWDDSGNTYYARKHGVLVLNSGSRLPTDHIVLTTCKKVVENVLYVNGNRTVRPVDTVDTNDTRLNVEASNLYRYFLFLRNNHESAYIRVKDDFSKVFPDVTSLSTPLLPQNRVRLDVTFDGLDTPIPLFDCGSGYTHVLTLLGLIHGQAESRLILFDEPQSFLHPAAEKALYEIVRRQDRHQIIFTTHSPILLNFPCEKSIHLLKKENGFTTYQPLNNTAPVLAEIGASNSDVALADKVLFVEGQTEQIVIPKIMEHFQLPQLGYNYVLVALGKTGDEFKGSIKLMTRNAQMYQTLFEGISHNKIPYRILLDRDESKTDIIGDAYGDKVILLKRRELENYFLDAHAIYDVVKDELEARNVDTDSLSSSRIQQLLAEIIEKTEDRTLYPSSTVEPLCDVIGSRVLQRIFTANQCTYSKPTHGLAFVNWFLANRPNDLIEIHDVLYEFLN